jgi:hypothetical protein
MFGYIASNTVETFRNVMTRATRSPLKAPPLRNPGQSIDEELYDALSGFLTPVFIAVVLLILAGTEWGRYYTGAPPAPWLYSVIAALGVAYAGYQFLRLRPQVRRLKQGRDGERVVGQYLERLREKGYQVFHDIVGDGFNVDHVLVGPAGVYTIETKTYSKPVKGDATIQFDGETLAADGFLPDRDPLVQAKAQASWLREIISESTGKTMHVHPVIVFPGWFIEKKAGSAKGVWVLNPKALPQFLDQAPGVLSAEDVNLVSFHLSRFIRSTRRLT